MVEDLSSVVVASVARQQELQRQLDDLTSSQTQQSRDLMASQSRDVEWLREWLDEERRMRQDMMMSQQLLQKALVDCLHSATASHQMSPVTVRHRQNHFSFQNLVTPAAEAGFIKSGRSRRRIWEKSADIIVFFLQKRDPCVST